MRSVMLSRRAYGVWLVCGCLFLVAPCRAFGEGGLPQPDSVGGQSFSAHATDDGTEHMWRRAFGRSLGLFGHPDELSRSVFAKVLRGRGFLRSSSQRGGRLASKVTRVSDGGVTPFWSCRGCLGGDVVPWRGRIRLAQSKGSQTKKQGTPGAPAGALQGKKNLVEWEWGLMLLQTFAGGVVATVSSVLSQEISNTLIFGTNVTAEKVSLASLVSSVIGLALVPWFVALTVYGIGRVSNTNEGSFWWTLLGAYLGSLASFGLGRLAQSLDPSPGKDTARPIRHALDGVLLVLGAMIFHTAFLRPYGDVIHLGSLLQWRKGSVHWGVPVATFAQEGGHSTVQLSLLQGRF